jgi:hypothetical protein
MQTSLLAWLDGTANQRIHQTTKRRPIELLIDEDLMEYVLPKETKQSNENDMISLERNHFSFKNAPTIPVHSLASYEEVAL